MTSQEKSSNSSVARSAGSMGLATFCSRILGLVREQVFAYLFGATHAADAFNIAFRIPNLLRDLFAEGAMSSAFVPNFTRALLESKQSAFSLLAGVLAVLLVIVSVISGFGIIFSRELVALYAGSFQSIPGKFELAVGLTSAMFPFFPLVALAAVLMGALNAMGFFFLPAFASAVFNMVSILCGLILCPLFANYSTIPPIFGMAIGVVAGGFFQFYVQWRQVRKQGFDPLLLKSEWIYPLRVPGVKNVLKLLIPGTVGLAATQLNILINSIYATSSGAGAVSWLNYAFRLMQFPIGIFGVSLAAATLPQVTRRLASADLQGASREINQSLRMSFAINGPAAAGLMGMGLPIVQLLFQHGKFQFSDSQATASAVFWYGVGLPGYSAVKVLVPIFYALGTTRIPVITSFAMVALNAVLNHLFLDLFHYPFWCLAAATSVTATLNAILLVGCLSVKIPGICNWGLLKSFIMHGVVSLAIGMGGAGVLKLISTNQGLPLHLTWFFQVSLSILLAGILWWALGRILGIEENERVMQFLLKKLRRTK